MMKAHELRDVAYKAAKPNYEVTLEKLKKEAEAGRLYANFELDELLESTRALLTQDGYIVQEKTKPNDMRKPKYWEVRFSDPG